MSCLPTYLQHLQQCSWVHAFRVYSSQGSQSPSVSAVIKELQGRNGGANVKNGVDNGLVDTEQEGESGWSERVALKHTCSVQFSSVAQSCPTLLDPVDCSTPGLPVHYQLPEFTQTHLHWVSDAIQPSHHLSSPSPPAFNLSQHQGLFK